MKFFIQRLIVFLLLISCGSFFEVDPQLAEVKKVGFLSVYINNNFYDRENFKEDLGIEMLGFFDDQSVQQPGANLPQKLAEYFLKGFYQRFDKYRGGRIFTLIPINDYLKSPAYQSPIKKEINDLMAFEFDDTFNIEEKYFSTPQGMKLLPLNKLVKNRQTKKDQTGLLSSSISYEEVGSFAQGMKMDGLFIAEIDAGYKKLTFLNGSKVKPSITFRMILIDQKGKDVLRIGRLFKEERKLYTGKVIEAKLVNEVIDFSINSEDLLFSYQQGIDKVLDNIFKTITWLR